jgi:hypothetical protein
MRGDCGAFLPAFLHRVLAPFVAALCTLSQHYVGDQATEDVHKPY